MVLIFVAVEPVCNAIYSSTQVSNPTTCTEETNLVTCSVNYTGNWAPVMRWYYTQADDVTLQQVNSSYVTKHTTESSVTYSVNTTRLDSLRNVIKLTCMTHFSDVTRPLAQPSSIRVANNTPSYTHNCSILVTKCVRVQPNHDTGGKSSSTENMLTTL